VLIVLRKNTIGNCFMRVLLRVTNFNQGKYLISRFLEHLIISTWMRRTDCTKIIL